jgi:hypothetical protein
MMALMELERNMMKNTIKGTDMYGHFVASMVKCMFRFVGFVFLFFGGMVYEIWPLSAAAIILIMAETVGVLEEFV